jgi:NADP-dependent 3-hydroxy acid dehydrogenase YdfG
MPTGTSARVPRWSPEPVVAWVGSPPGGWPPRAGRWPAAYRDAAGLTATAARFPAQILPLAADLTDPEATRTVTTAASTALGTPDRVVAAAGVAHVGPLLDDDPDAVLRVVSVNYGATVRIVSAAVPAMLHRGGGEIVILGSIAGHCPQRKMGAYAASKAALIAYARRCGWRTATAG